MTDIIWRQFSFHRYCLFSNNWEATLKYALITCKPKKVKINIRELKWWRSAVGAYVVDLEHTKENAQYFFQRWNSVSYITKQNNEKYTEQYKERHNNLLQWKEKKSDYFSYSSLKIKTEWKIAAWEKKKVIIYKNLESLHKMLSKDIHGSRRNTHTS